MTCTWLAPTLLRRLFEALDNRSSAVSGVELPALRLILGGGEKSPPSVMERLVKNWPSANYYDAQGYPCNRRSAGQVVFHGRFARVRLLSQAITRRRRAACSTKEVV